MDGGLSDFLRMRFVRKEAASDDSSSRTIVFFLCFFTVNSQRVRSLSQQLPIASNLNSCFNEIVVGDSTRSSVFQILFKHDCTIAIVSEIRDPCNVVSLHADISSYASHDTDQINGRPFLREAITATTSRCRRNIAHG